jgi:hypothetical protein
VLGPRAAAYASAIRTPGLLPNAQIVVDHFHLVKLANDALTKVRRSGMKDTVSHYVPPHSPLTSTEPQVFSNNLTMPCRLRAGFPPLCGATVTPWGSG